MTEIFVKEIIANDDYRFYSDCSHFGSIALTRHGQGVADQVEIQG